MPLSSRRESGPNPRTAAPRTSDERLAYISGYAQAVLDIYRHDLPFARRMLGNMVGLEIEPPPKKRD